MIHHSCDCCKRVLEADDLRYVVKMEIHMAFDPAATEAMDDDRDHLLEIQEILQQAADADDPNIGEEIDRRMRFDLCPECCKKFTKNPLGRDLSKQFSFSKN